MSSPLPLGLIQVELARTRLPARRLELLGDVLLYTPDVPAIQIPRRSRPRPPNEKFGQTPLNSDISQWGLSFSPLRASTAPREPLMDDASLRVEVAHERAQSYISVS
jgi:hypothetical protein